MKTKLPFLLAAFAAVAFTMDAQAKIWRVNNVGYSANFTSLQAANDNPNVGTNPLVPDTIQLEGRILHMTLQLSPKRLVIIGAGYFLAENANTSSSLLETKIQWVNFGASSAGSQLIGVWTVSGNNVSVNASNIVIKRCRINASITLGQGIINIKILQNFFPNTSTSSAINDNGNDFPTDVIINNNIFVRRVVLANNTSYTVTECKNNIFAYPTNGLAIQMYVASFENNILVNPNTTVTLNGGNFNNVSYNVSASANNQFGTSNNNIVVPDFSSWFVSILTATSTDKDFQLRTGTAPGSDGTDRGAFGGAAVTNRYTLSGLAPVPVIYQITTTGVATPAGQLPVTIKARTIQ